MIRDQQAPRFDAAGASDRGGQLRITVSDNWALQSIQVLRDGYATQDLAFSADEQTREHQLTASFTRPGTYRIVATDHAGGQTQLWARGRCFPDGDGDGLSDAYERLHGLDREDPDSDGDGLSDGDEVLRHRTDPLDPDSDHDGVNDFMAVALKAQGLAPERGPMALMLGGGGTATGDPIDWQALSGQDLLQPLRTAPLNIEEIDYLPAQTLLAGRDAQGQWIATQGSLLLQLARARNGSLQPAAALDLAALLTPDDQPLPSTAGSTRQTAILSDAAGRALLIGLWDSEASRLSQDLLLIDTQTLQSYRLPESRGATRFDIAPGGSRLAWLVDDQLHVLDLAARQHQVKEDAPGLMGFTMEDEPILGIEDGQALVLGAQGEVRPQPFAGLLHQGQPTNSHRDLILLGQDSALPLQLSTTLTLNEAGDRIRMLSTPGQAEAAEQLLNIPR